MQPGLGGVDLVEGEACEAHQVPVKPGQPFLQVRTASAVIGIALLPKR